MGDAGAAELVHARDEEHGVEAPGSHQADGALRRSHALLIDKGTG